MKNPFLVLIALFLLINVTTVMAQAHDNTGLNYPSITNRPELFGNDVVISNQPQQDQKNLVMCSAPNGWLYSAYSYDSLGQSKIGIMRSKDQGYTWQILGIIPFLGGPEEVVKKLDILVTGNNESDQKLFFAYVSHDGMGNRDFIDFLRYDCDPFEFETRFFYNYSFAYHDVSIASDHNYPAIGSNPNSIGVIYSATGTRDSIIFRSCSDGGISFNNRKVVAVTTKRFHKVALSYGASYSQNTGRYYAAWEEQSDATPNLGNIYTSHSDPGFNSPFTVPVKLDGLDPTLVNLCRNPVIACQVNNLDNDSSNLSEIVLFEKYNPGSGDYDVTGFYNKRSTVSNTFTRLNIAATSNNEMQPDIAFNTYDNNFMVTFFDSTTQKLPLYNKNFNLENPDNWNVVIPAYNDNGILRSPSPQVNVNQENHFAVNAWVKESNTGKGVALFDAPYIPPVGMPDNETLENVRVLTFPNPCSTTVSIAFEMTRTEKVTITLFDMVGRPMGMLTDQCYSKGKHKVVKDISRLHVGLYFYAFSAGDFFTSGRICVIR